MPATNIKWFDYRGHSDAKFQFYVGARGIGKSYSALDEIYKTGLREKGIHKWLYIRMSEIELKCCCGSENAFGDYNMENGTDIQMEYNNKLVNIMLYDPYKSDDIEYTSTCIGYAKSLETFSNLRSVSFADVDYIMFDEFIPQIVSRKKPIYKMAGTVFKNLYETVNRNRELKGREPVKCYFFGNSNSIDSDILREFELLEILSHMLKTGVKKYSDKSRSVYLELCTAPDVTEKKRDTALYKLGGDKNFNAMALDNSFPVEEFLLISTKPKNEYVPVIQFGEFSIWKHKSNDNWYICKSNSSAKIRYSETDENLFYRNHNVEYVCRILEKRVNFDSAYTKNVIHKILGRNLK